jgi:hypothetical protein
MMAPPMRARGQRCGHVLRDPEHGQQTGGGAHQHEGREHHGGAQHHGRCAVAHGAGHEDAHDADREADARQDERERHGGGPGVAHAAVDQERGERGVFGGEGDGHGGDHGGDQRLVDVGAHAGHVTHVVTHVVGDDAGVARVVFGDVLDHLAGDVGAHVGRLGVDAAADAREERDGGRAEPRTRAARWPRAAFAWASPMGYT